MWDCLVKLSTWAEGNSGQIQIVIGLIALGLAILGYKKVLEQIEISNKLERKANEQKGYELKLQSLNILLSALDRNHVTLKNLDQIVNNLENISLRYEDIENINRKEIRELIQSTEDKTKEFKELQETIKELWEKINNREAVDQATLDNINKALFGAIIDSHEIEFKYLIFEKYNS